MCTRTPWEENLYFVGVPPYDILDRILTKTNGKNLVQQKRSELEALLQDSARLELELQRRIDIGMIDLSKIAESLRGSTSTKHAGCKVSEEEFGNAREHCLRKLKSELQTWSDRLMVFICVWAPRSLKADLLSTLVSE